MSISPNDLLSQAEGLLADAKTEVDFRNVIGRAYYAAYHKAHWYHAQLGSPGRNPSRPLGMHATLAHRLQHPTLAVTDVRHRRSQNIGRHLEALHKDRVEADYRLESDVSQVKAKKILERAKRVFELCAPVRLMDV